jgi:hypothetical protein
MIRLKVKSWTGAEFEATLLGWRGLRMRIAVPGDEDAAELWCQGGQWFTEDGLPVQLIYLTLEEPDDLLGFGPVCLQLPDDPPPLVN